MSKKLLVVFGATGNQGGSIASTVLDDPNLSAQYTIRAITRSSSNPKAQALQTKGAEIVEANLDDPKSLIAALEGAHTVFATTNTRYGAGAREIETRQAKALCDAALKQGAQYLIWSSMSHPALLSQGKLKHVEHFDVKAEMEQYIRSLPIQSAFIAPGSFMQNLYSVMAPRPSPANDGSYVIANVCAPDTPIPFINITETGKWIASILAEPEKYEGSFFAAAEGLYTYQQVVDIVSKVTGKKVVFQQVSEDVFKSWIPDQTQAVQMCEMLMFMRDYLYYGPEQRELVQWAKEQARGKLTGLEEFLRREGFTLE